MRYLQGDGHGSLQLAEVAWLYYGQDWTQERIAQETGLSRPTVSRMLKDARERGIVDIRVHYPFQSVPELEHALRDRFGLADCRVLATGQANLLDGVGEDIPYRVGVLAARYLQKQISDNSIIGFGWGSMVANVVSSGYLTKKRGLTVVQIQGSIGAPTLDIDGARIISSLGRTLGAAVYHLSAPMVVADTAVRTGLLRDQHILRTLEIGRRADTLVVGVGAVSPQSGLYRAGYLNEVDLNYIGSQGAVGDICGSYFKQDGSLCPLELNDRMIALNAATMQQVPQRVGVSCGLPKAVPNVGAVRSGLINVLITDDHAAEEMLALAEQEDPLPLAASPARSSYDR